MVEDEIITQVIDLARQRNLQAEVYYQSSQDTPIEFANNRLKSLETKASKGMALRVIDGDRLGFASSSNLTRLEALVEAAVATAEVGDKVDFEFTKDVNYIAPESNFQPPATQELVEVGKSLVARVREYNPEILVDVSFHSRTSKVKLATTTNVRTERSSKTASAILSGNLVKGEDFLQAYTYEVTRDRVPDYEAIFNRLIQKYEYARRSATIASGSYPVLFTPGAAASAIGRLFNTILSGRSVVQKSSPLADKLGQSVFDERLSVFEDPSIGASACPVDDEGVPTTKKTLIDCGKIEQFYWDRRWAARGGVQPGGNGFRGGLSRPNPSLVNLAIAPGSTSVEDLIAGIDEGIIIDQVLGAGQSNQLAGEFSVNVDLGYKVEKGQIVGRIKNTMVAGNIFEAFDNLIDLSDRAEWVGSSSYLPHLLFGSLGVAAKQ